MNELVVMLFTFGCAAVTLAAIIWVLLFQHSRFEKKYRASLATVSAAVEARTGAKGHSDWIRKLSDQVARSLKCSKHQRKCIEIAVYVREIGLVTVPYKQLRGKPRNQWTVEEWKVFDRHPEVGASMLSLVPALERVAHVVRCHHAPYSGTPQSYLPAGAELPIESRIISTVNEYVERYCSQGSVLARDVLIEQRGTKFDPKVVDALLSVLTSPGVKRRLEPTFKP